MATPTDSGAATSQLIVTAMTRCPVCGTRLQGAVANGEITLARTDLCAQVMLVHFGSNEKAYACTKAKDHVGDHECA